VLGFGSAEKRKCHRCGKKRCKKKMATLDCKGSPILGRNKEWQKRMCANSKLTQN